MAKPLRPTIKNSVPVLIILLLSEVKEMAPVNLHVLTPATIQTWPLNQSVIAAINPIDIGIFQGAASQLPPIQRDRIAVNKGANRNAPRPYTIAELEEYATAWGLRPAKGKRNIVDQVLAEYNRRYSSPESESATQQNEPQTVSAGLECRSRGRTTIVS